MVFSKEDVLRRGFVYVKVIVSGLRQSHKLTVKKERTQQGIFTYLHGRYAIPESEMVRVAEELQLPVKTKDVLVFPKGKMQGDYTEKTENQVIGDPITIVRK